MATEHKTRLTSTEIGILWIQYVGDTMSKCVNKVHATQVQDDQVRSLYQDAISLTENTTAQISQMFQKEGIPLPQGFTDDDINLDAPPLYSEIYSLQYFKFKMNLRMVVNGLGIADSTRADVRKLYRNITNIVLDLEDRATNLLLERGLYIRAPYITVGTEAGFVQNETFLGNFFNGKERKMLASEIGTQFSNIRNNLMGKILLTGFSQVAESPVIRDYMNRGVDIANKHIQILSEYLREEDIPRPMSSDLGVTNSTIAPFSDKLMLHHANLLNQIGMAAYGTAMSASMRKDIHACYVRLATEIALYGLDGANLLIENSWMEEAPEAVDHRELGLHH